MNAQLFSGAVTVARSGIRWARRCVLAVLALAAVRPDASAANVLTWLFPKQDVHVIAVTDTTPAGALRRPAWPDKPVYYFAVNAGYQDLGGTVAGEKLPPKDDVLKLIAKVLAKQGYLPATEQHPASLLLVWTWGTLNADRMPTTDPEIVEERQVNRRQMLRFLGAYKVGLISKDRSGWGDEMLFPGLLFRDADAEMLYDLSTEDLYVAAIGAYDYTAAAERKEKVLLWTTKISCPSRGLIMAETLSAMLAIAGPYIGRETARPVSIKASEHFKPEVKIGDPTTVEYLEKNPLPVLDAPASNAKAKRPSDNKTRK